MSAGLRVRSGLRAPAPIDRPGIGSEADQYRRLEHAAARHGLRPFSCPGCSGNDCAICGGEGLLFRPGNPEPCGPECPLLQLKPA